MKRLLLALSLCATTLLPSSAQEVITGFPVIPDKSVQTFENYILTHTVEEMDGDTVTLANVYSSMGVTVFDKLLGPVPAYRFFLTIQDFSFVDTTYTQQATGLLYVPVAPATKGKYELTEQSVSAIEKKLNGKFDLNGDNFVFRRNDKFVVKAKLDAFGKKVVTFHCISYPRYYILDVGKDEDKGQ